jgi:hypothetical protein
MAQPQATKMSQSRFCFGEFPLAPDARWAVGWDTEEFARQRRT